MIEVSSGGDQFPELRILAGHIGVPWLGEMLSLVMKYTNVFIDTSAYKVIRYPKDLVDYMRRSNRQKVLFGSNHPFWPACECLADFDKLGLSEKAATLFLADNAKTSSSSTKSSARALAGSDRSQAVKEYRHAVDDRAQA